VSLPPIRSQAGNTTDRVALVTGTGRRLGTHIAQALHAEGWRVALHYYHSAAPALALREALNVARADSAMAIAADLRAHAALAEVVAAVQAAWGRLDALVNNAAVFFATPLSEATLAQWDEIMTINLQAPYFLSQAAAPLLKKSGGCIVNLTDIYAERPRADYAIYCASKAGLIGITRALARELAPGVRVNAVSPGAILWSSDATPAEQQAVLARTPLGRAGDPSDITVAVRYLIDSPYVTGQILTVDGGRTIID
jgi:pteridine reductase